MNSDCCLDFSTDLFTMLQIFYPMLRNNCLRSLKIIIAMLLQVDASLNESNTNLIECCVMDTTTDQDFDAMDKSLNVTTVNPNTLNKSICQSAQIGQHNESLTNDASDQSNPSSKNATSNNINPLDQIPASTSGVMNQLYTSICMAKYSVSPNLYSGNDKIFLNGLSRVFENTKIPDFTHVTGINLQTNDTKECLDAIYCYITVLTNDYHANNQRYGIFNSWGLIKKAFILENNQELVDLNVKKVMPINFYLSTTSKFWLKCDFVEFNEYIARQSYKDRDILFNWVAWAMRGQHGFDEKVMKEWSNRELVASKYFNKDSIANTPMADANRFKLLLHNITVILGSKPFKSRITMNLPQNSTITDEIELQLNAFRSPYFIISLFGAIDFITGLSDEVHVKYVDELYNIFEHVENAIFDTFGRKPCTEVTSNPYRGCSVDVLPELKNAREGLSCYGVVKKILNKIDILTNDWISEIGAPVNGKMTEASYRITSFTWLLKNILVTLHDFTVMITKRDLNMEMHPSESGRRIFVLLTMFSFDFEKVCQFLHTNLAQP